MIPRGSSQCLPSKKLGFSTVFCRSPFVGHRVLVSRTSAKPIGWNLGFLVNAPVKESFVVRAESNEVEASESVEERQEDTVEAEGDAVDAEAEVEVEEEEEEAKAPRTPRVKLGDIMGVIISSIKIVLFVLLMLCLVSEEMLEKGSLKMGFL